MTRRTTRMFTAALVMAATSLLGVVRSAEASDDEPTAQQASEEPTRSVSEVRARPRD